jgi:hypothetical protein
MDAGFLQDNTTVLMHKMRVAPCTHIQSYPVSAVPVSAVSVIRGLPQPEKEFGKLKK